MTWNWHLHLEDALQSVLGRVESDARGLTQWLSERMYTRGLTASYEQTREGCLDKVFFLEEGAKEH